MFNKCICKFSQIILQIFFIGQTIVLSGDFRWIEMLRIGFIFTRSIKEHYWNGLLLSIWNRYSLFLIWLPMHWCVNAFMEFILFMSAIYGALLCCEGHLTICSVKYLFGGNFILARIFGEIFCPLEISEVEFAKII